MRGLTIVTLINEETTVGDHSVNLNLNIWNQLCITAVKDQSYELFTKDTASLFNISSSIANQKDFKKTRPTMQLLLGSNNEVFIGCFADIRMSDTITINSSNNIKYFKTCEIENSMDVFRPIVPDGEFNSTANIAKIVMKKFDLCNSRKPVKFLVTTKFCHNYYWAKKYCENLGGRLPSLRQDRISDVLDDFFYVMEYKTSTTNMIWLNSDGNRTMCNGISITVKSFNGYSYENITETCTTHVTDVVCIVPSDLNVKFIIGNKVSSLMYPVYNRHKVVFTNGNLDMLSYHECPENSEAVCLSYSSIIGYSYQVQLPVNKNELLFIGRRIWDSCDRVASLLAVTTICNETQFTCDSGSCIDLNLRCDDITDCDDQSDEGESCRKLMPIPNSYWKEICPDSPKSPLITIIVKNLGVDDVFMSQNHLKINMLVTLQWSDLRLNFTGIHRGKIGQLRSEEFQQLWMPKLSTPNGIYEDLKNVQKREELIETFFVDTSANGIRSYHESREGKFRLNLILLRKQKFVDFS